ncbi:tail assembly chaperone [Pseudomonas phage SM1]|uniref:Tail assembly protein n=2 Tax=Samunavirus TaxID=2560221 RepID=A0A0U3E4J1_9CAUD|nr:tail assembly chaperone [Pseudomonas phage SM1]UGC97138.1 hypothetical protein [Pseudomonas phage BHU-1]UGV19903.1 hypothetical protein [Pseudomonas phage Pa BHU-15]UIW13657.1 hypothetical protein [Pseudomonas phage Pa BHU-17]UVN14057.1 hypothetical protein FBPa45_0055 [Pseudomonas phage vB_PaeS_FBPa45]WDS62555.1 hypothetical protein UFRH6_129 [Pseudomonas phage UF_RH6]HBO9768538.1 hypothetical protein [Pseudomonas aeruginosa]
MQALYYLAWIAISYYINKAIAPKPDKPKPAALSDWNFPQFEEGTPQAVVFGDVWTEDWMVLGLGNYRTSKIKTKSGK